jgi:hypothetical protein
MFLRTRFSSKGSEMCLQLLDVKDGDGFINLDFIWNVKGETVWDTRTEFITGNQN